MTGNKKFAPFIYLCKNLPPIKGKMTFSFSVDKSAELVVWTVFFLWEFTFLAWKHIVHYDKKYGESLLSVFSFSLEWMMACAIVIKGLGIAAIFLFLNYACDTDCGQWQFLTVYIMIVVSVLLSKMHLPLYRMARSYHKHEKNISMANWMNMSSAAAASLAFALNVCILAFMGVANTGIYNKWLPFGLFFPYMLASLYATYILGSWYLDEADFYLLADVSVGVGGAKASAKVHVGGATSHHQHQRTRV